MGRKIDSLSWPPTLGFGPDPVYLFCLPLSHIAALLLEFMFAAPSEASTLPRPTRSREGFWTAAAAASSRRGQPSFLLLLSSDPMCNVHVVWCYCV